VHRIVFTVFFLHKHFRSNLLSTQSSMQAVRRAPTAIFPVLVVYV
jgi:hypothetical protein